MEDLSSESSIHHLPFSNPIAQDLANQDLDQLLVPRLIQLDMWHAVHVSEGMLELEGLPGMTSVWG